MRTTKHTSLNFGSTTVVATATGGAMLGVSLGSIPGAVIGAVVGALVGAWSDMPGGRRKKRPARATAHH